MKIPDEVKSITKNRDTSISIRITSKDKKFLDEYNISPTRMFNWAIKLIKKDEINRLMKDLEKELQKGEKK